MFCDLATETDKVSGRVTGGSFALFSESINVDVALLSSEGGALHICLYKHHFKRKVCLVRKRIGDVTKMRVVLSSFFFLLFVLKVLPFFYWNLNTTWTVKPSSKAFCVRSIKDWVSSTCLKICCSKSSGWTL